MSETVPREPSADHAARKDETSPSTVEGGGMRAAEPVATAPPAPAVATVEDYEKAFAATKTVEGRDRLAQDLATQLERDPGSALAAAISSSPLDEATKLVWFTLADRVLDEDVSSPAGRARNGVRLALLTGAGERGISELRQIAKVVEDAPTRAYVHELIGEHHEKRAVRIEGRWRLAASTRRRRLFAYLTGFALLRWIARGGLWLAGLRRTVEVVFDDTSLELITRISVFGRVVREQKTVVGLNAVRGVARESRAAILPLVVGTMTFAIGVVVGVLAFFDGLRGEQPALITLGLGLIVSGVFIDFMIDVVAARWRDEVILDITYAPEGHVRLAGLRRPDADRFLGRVREALSSA